MTKPNRIALKYEVSGVSTKPEDIAEELANEIIAAQKAGKLDGSNDFRLLIMGYSWGGDKAITVVKLLNDRLRRAMYEDPLFGNSGFQMSKVRIYLATLDAFPNGQGSLPPHGVGTNVPNVLEGTYGRDVTDWFNRYQRTEGDFANGISYPTAGTNRSVLGATHATFPSNKAVVDALLEWLGLQ